MLLKKRLNRDCLQQPDIVAQLSFSRTQASRLANRFVDQGIFFKINTRPVLFGNRGGYQEKFAIEVSEVLNSVKELSDKIEKVPINRVFEKSDRLR